MTSAPASIDHRGAFDLAPVGLVISSHRKIVDCNQVVAEIFRTQGEARFRELEKNLAEGLGTTVARVIAWGGGAWLKAENRKRMLESGTVILLTCSEEELWKRLEPEVAIRPLLAGPDPRESFRRLLKKRKSAYKGADMTVATTGKSAEEIARDILKRLRA